MAWKSHLQGCQSVTLCFISPDVENRSLSLFEIILPEYLGVYQKLKNISALFSWGLLDPIRYLFKIHKFENAHGKKGVYCKHHRVLFVSCIFSSLVTVVSWFEILKYNRKHLDPEKCPACQLYSFALLIHSPLGRSMRNDIAAESSMSLGAQGPSFISFSSFALAFKLDNVLSV